MKIPITLVVDDRARFRRRGEPVAVGVSFASGEVQSGESWSLRDQEGRAVAAQTTILDRWRDESVRWMLVEFKADADGDGERSYSLVNTPTVTRERLTVTASADELTVDTGLARFVVAQRGAVAIARAEVANQAVLTDLTVTAHDAEGRAYLFAVSQATLTQIWSPYGGCSLQWFVGGQGWHALGRVDRDPSVPCGAGRGSGRSVVHQSSRRRSSPRPLGFGRSGLDIHSGSSSDDAARAPRCWNYCRVARSRKSDE